MFCFVMEISWNCILWKKVEGVYYSTVTINVWFVKIIILKNKRSENSINVWLVTTIILRNRTEYAKMFIPFQSGRNLLTQTTDFQGTFMLPNPTEWTKLRTGEQWQRALLFLQDTRHLGGSGTQQPEWILMKFPVFAGWKKHAKPCRSNVGKS